jgi:hypothetical protein
MRLKIYWDESRVWIQGIDIRCTVFRRTARSSMKAPDSSCLKEKNINVHDSSDRAHALKGKQFGSVSEEPCKKLQNKSFGRSQLLLSLGNP